MSFNPRKFSWRWISLFIFQCEEVRHYKDRMSFTQYPSVIRAVIPSFPRRAGTQIWGHVPTLLHHWTMHPPWGVCFKISLHGVCVFGGRGVTPRSLKCSLQIPWNWSYRRFWAQHRCWELNLVFWKISMQSTTCSSRQPMIYVCICFWLPRYQFLCSFYSNHTYYNCHWISFHKQCSSSHSYFDSKVLFCNLLKEDHI